MYNIGYEFSAFTHKLFDLIAAFFIMHDTFICSAHSLPYTYIHATCMPFTIPYLSWAAKKKKTASMSHET